MSVDVLTEGRVAWHAQRHVAGLSGVGDDPGATVAHDDRRVAEQLGQAVMAEVVVASATSGGRVAPCWTTKWTSRWWVAAESIQSTMRPKG